MADHYFKYELTNPDRNIKKADWVAIQRWLRIARNKIELEMPLDKVQRHITELMTTGRTVFDA